jgi:putative membrane protein
LQTVEVGLKLRRMALLVSWIAVAFGLWLADKLLPKFTITGDWKSYAIVAALLGVLQFLLGWLLYVVLGIATLGLGFLFGFITRLVVSAIVLLIADKLSRRLTIDGFVTALLASVVVSLTGSVADFLLR